MSDLIPFTLRIWKESKNPWVEMGPGERFKCQRKGSHIIDGQRRMVESCTRIRVDRVRGAEIPETNNRRPGEQENRRTGEQENRTLGDQETRRIGEQENRISGNQENRRPGEQDTRRTGHQETRKPGE